MSIPSAKTRANGAPAAPWWRVKMMWLVLGGPAMVVVASIVTAVIAYRGADEVLTESNQPAPDATAANRALTPAMTARNHAATPSP
jgi:hypothetical protein